VRNCSLLTGFALLALTALSPAARAQEKKDEPLKVDGKEVSDLQDIEDATFEGLLGMDLSDRLGATKAVSRSAEEVLRAPATLSTLTGNQLRRSGATTIPDLLRGVPGVQVLRSAPGNFVVSLRGAGGLGGNNVVVTIDGIPINSPLDGSVDWDTIPVHPHDVERIEVVRGPVSTAYGANAYTGVINIVTRDALGISPAHALRAELGMSPDEALGLASTSGRLVHVGPKLRLKWLFDSSYDAMNRGSGGALQPAHERAGFVGKLGYQWSKRASASLEIGRAVSRRSSLDHLVLEPERQRRELLFGQLKLEGGGVGVVRSYQLWGRSALLNTRTDPAAYRGFSYADTDSNRAALGGDVDLAFSPMFGASMGALGTLDYVSAPYLHPNENAKNRSGYGAYAGLNVHPTESLDVRLAVRGDVSALTAKLEESYRGSVVYHGDSFGLRLSGATAFREPSYVEASGRFVDPASRLILLEGTPTIESPRNSSLELGAMVAPTSALNINPVVYVSRFDNAIIEDFAPLVRRTFRNDPEPRTLLGAELSVDWRVSDSITLQPTVSMLRFLSVDEEHVATIGVPAQNSAVTAGLRMDGWLLDERLAYGLGALYVSGREYSVRAGIPPRIIAASVPAAAYLDASVQYELLSAQPLRLSLRGVTHLPSQLVESPLPNAAPLGSTLVLGLEYASE
jgi:outer membrane receptor protein involved in Fe transport